MHSGCEYLCSYFQTAFVKLTLKRIVNSYVILKWVTIILRTISTKGGCSMGSRIMHLIIADKIAEKLSIKDRTAFLLGGIAPDAVNSKDSSHFFRGDHADFSRYVAYKEFIEKYSSSINNPYILGYYTHLIADDLWLQGFYVPWLKNRIESDDTIAKAYHNDFSLLNGKLLEYYGYKNELVKLLNMSTDIINLEEVPEENIQKFIPYILEDMDYDHHDIDENLKVFTLEQIIGYIETTVNKGVIYIKQLLT